MEFTLGYITGFCAGAAVMSFYFARRFRKLEKTVIETYEHTHQ